MAEGVFLASGAPVHSADDGCYKVSARIHQSPEMGRGDYRIQVDAKHSANDGHMTDNERLIISFNQPVTYVSCNGQGATLVSGDGTNTLTIDYTYHQNANDNIGLGDLIVTADAGLSILPDLPEARNPRMLCKGNGDY